MKDINISKRWILFMVLLDLLYIHAQCEKINMFKYFTFVNNNDTINYHAYAKGEVSSKENILLFIHGSSSKPFYSFFKEKGIQYRGSTMPFDLKEIPDDYAFFIVSKKYIPFCVDSKKEFKAPEVYHKTMTLKHRAYQIDKVIKDILRNYIQKPKRIVVIGHSEGSDVVAKVGSINKEITHVGFWSGSGNSQWYDFPLFIRKDVLNGKLTEEEGLKQMDSLFVKYKEIIKNKASIHKKWYGHPYKRWYYFSEPPIENLLQINVPLYVAMGAKDSSVPVESTYLIPVEFIRNEKENLTFKVYPNLDHSFNEKLPNGKKKRHWNTVFLDFMKWVKNN